MAHDRSVQLERHPLGGFGFSVIGGVDTELPPMVCAIVHNGAAQLSGKVYVGDVILEVNGKPITHLKTKEVVAAIRHSTDTLSLKLREDEGAKERAGNYLKPFVVEDPKLGLYKCQSKLRRSQSAPRQFRDRASTDQLHRKEFRVTREGNQAMSHGRGSVGSDDIRYVGRMTSQGLEGGADGLYRSRKLSGFAASNHTRMETCFPADNTPPSTKVERSPKSSARRSESVRVERSPKTSTRRTESLRVNPATKKAALRSRTSDISLPSFCQNCGEPTSFIRAETLSNSSINSIVCPNCGMEMRSVSSSSGGSLPGTPYAKRKEFNASSESRLTDASSSSPSDRGKAANGSVKLSESERKQGEHHAKHEAARMRAKQIFHRDGYKKEDVAAELSKNTSLGRAVATEYLKFYNFSEETLLQSLRKFLKDFPLTGETQERERVLIAFTKRYHDCNHPEYGSEDAVHTLVCAIMLLNTDLNGEVTEAQKMSVFVCVSIRTSKEVLKTIGTKMKYGQFVDNLAGLCDCKDFPRELLKTIYQEIKTSPLEWCGVIKESTSSGNGKGANGNGIKATPGNPFLEIQTDENAKVYKEGLLYRKATMDSDGKKTSAWKRKWVPFDAVLRGLILFLTKPDEASNYDNTRNCVGVHHAFTSRAVDYKKKQFVFRFVTSDWRAFLFQARDQKDMNEWIEAINLVAATYSAPPLPAPIGSSKKFQRPVLPFSQTRLTLAQQLDHHEKKAKEMEDELIVCLNLQPREGTAREIGEWQEKHDYLEYEYKRYRSYVNVLRGSKLESRLREKSHRSGRSEFANGSLLMQLKRSSSLGSIELLGGGLKMRNNRASYFMAIYR